MSVERADVDRLYEAVLAPKIAELEGLRLQLKKTITKALVLVVAPFLLFWFGDFIAILLPAGFGFLISALGIVLVFAAVVFAGVRYLIPGFTNYLNYRQRFKHEVVTEIFKIVCPTATYDPDHGVPQELFDDPGIFSTRGSFKSDDRVRGKIGDTPFEAAEVQRQYSTGGKNSTTYVVFKGLFFHIDFNKAVRGTTIVQPESAPSYRVGNRDGLQPVPLESPDFEQEFAVYADNEVEARYILTPVMMEQLLSLRQRSGHPVYMAFRNNRVYLGINYGRPLFEPGIASTTSKEAIEEMAGLFALAETIVHELDLNTRIWTKDVDDSLLKRPDEAPKDGLDALAAQARTGTLTPEQLWAAATASVGVSTDEDSGPVERPSGSSIAIDRSPGSVTIAYAGTATFLVLIVLWVVSVLVSISAARALVASFSGTTGLGPLQGLGEALPAIPVADAYTVTEPIAWFLGAAIPGSLIALGWMFRVRKVEIAPDAVHILRGLRPWPRRYPRPPYDKVIVIERAVYVGKATGLNLVNPSASPMLKADEARWVAREMRQAMKETAAMRTSMIVLAFTLLAGLASAQPGTAARNDLPQPYQTTRDWGELPPGVKWAAVTAIEPAPDGTIYVVHRCFANSCAGRPEAPILKYNAAGQAARAAGAQGMFVFPHGATVDRDGNLWVTDARGDGRQGAPGLQVQPRRARC